MIKGNSSSSIWSVTTIKVQHKEGTESLSMKVANRLQNAACCTAGRKLSSPLSTVKEQDYSASPYMAGRSCSGREKERERERERKIMDIENLNCGQAPSSNNAEIFFVISGILTRFNNPLLIILKIRSTSPYCRVRTNECRHLFWRCPVLFSSGFSLSLGSMFHSLICMDVKRCHLSYSDNAN